jgi:hypothetical protein
MWYWVVFGTASVVIATCVVYSIVGLFEVLREPTLEGTVNSDLWSAAVPLSPAGSVKMAGVIPAAGREDGSSSATSPDAGA